VPVIVTCHHLVPCASCGCEYQTKLLRLEPSFLPRLICAMCRNAQHSHRAILHDPNTKHLEEDTRALSLSLSLLPGICYQSPIHRAHPGSCVRKAFVWLAKETSA
jgi:hypothetical protein